MCLWMDVSGSNRMLWVMKIRTTWWFWADLEMRRPPGFKIVGQLSFFADHRFESELDCQCYFWLNWPKSFAVVDVHVWNRGWQEKAEAGWSPCSLVLVWTIARHRNIKRGFMWTALVLCNPCYRIKSYELGEATGRTSSSARQSPASALASWLWFMLFINDIQISCRLTICTYSKWVNFVLNGPCPFDMHSGTFFDSAR